MSDLMVDREVDESSIDLVRQAVATACKAPIETLCISTRPADVKGWDSFGRLQVVLELERLIGRELPLERAIAADTLSELAALLSETSG